MKASKQFFGDNLSGRMTLMRVERHISQAACSYDANGILIPPPPDSPLWIVERLLVKLETEFMLAKRAMSDGRKKDRA